MKKSLIYRAVVVGAVIASFMVLIFLAIEPHAIISIHKAEETQAKSEVKAIENALRVYLSDYNKFPEYGSCRLQSTGAGQMDATLTDILRGLNTNADANHRAFVYLDVDEKRLGTNTVTATGGRGVAGAFYDPWGNLYQIAVDYRSSNLVVHADGETLSNRTVAVWSWGPNKTAHPDPNDPTHIRSWK